MAHRLAHSGPHGPYACWTGSRHGGAPYSSPSVCSAPGATFIWVPDKSLALSCRVGRPQVLRVGDLPEAKEPSPNTEPPVRWETPVLDVRNPAPSPVGVLASPKRLTAGYMGGGILLRGFVVMKGRSLGFLRGEEPNTRARCLEPGLTGRAPGRDGDKVSFRPQSTALVNSRLTSGRGAAAAPDPNPGDVASPPSAPGDSREAGAASSSGAGTACDTVSGRLGAASRARLGLVTEPAPSAADEGIPDPGSPPVPIGMLCG